MLKTISSSIILVIVAYFASFYYNRDSTSASTSSKELKAETVVFGFLPDYRLDAAAYSFIIPRVTHLCLFGSEGNAKTGELIERIPSQEKLKLIRDLCKRHNTKLLVAFGGAGRSQFFSDLADNKQKLRDFTENLANFVKRESLDGIELNWMYPSRGIDLQALKYIVHRLRETKPDLIITMAIPPQYQMAKVISDFDFDLFHVMVYQATVAGPNAIEQSEEIMKSLLPYIAADKLTLGIPFYSVQGQESFSFEDIITKKLPVQYETAEVLKKKKERAEQLGLKGISIWELGQDCRVEKVGIHKKTCPNGPNDSLLSAVGRK